MKELAYGEIAEKLPNDELIGELVRSQLIYYPTVTRDPFRHTGRLSAALTSGAMTEALGLPPIDPAHDRFMLCGSPAMLADLRAILDRARLRRRKHRRARRLRDREGLRRQVNRSGCAGELQTPSRSPRRPWKTGAEPRDFHVLPFLSKIFNLLPNGLR